MMRGFDLTVQEVQYLRVGHRGCRDKRLADRIKAVVLLGTGWTLADVAEALLLDEDTVRQYVQLYQQGGVDGLLTLHYQGSQPKLTPDQRKQLDAHLQEPCMAMSKTLLAMWRANSVFSTASKA